MSERHLPKGSPLPAVSPDVVRVYSMKFCPYAERARLVLNHKQIPFEIVNVDLKNKPEWLLERNCDGTVPVLEYKGHCMSETAVIEEFLEESFPIAGPNPLLPSTPFEKAAARLFMRRFDAKKNVVLLLKAQSADPENFQKTVEEHLSGIQFLENHLASSGQAFFSGNQVGMSDLHVWPFFERAPAVAETLKMELYPADKYPRLNKWIQTMKEVDAVKKTMIPPELHKRFLSTFLEGNPQYDIELN